jgi:hypothetical protein
MRPIVLLALLANALPSQGLVSGQVSTNPVMPGQTVTFTVTNASSQSLNLGSGCAYAAVRQGLPSGPIVYNPICTTILVNLPPCGTVTTPYTPAAGLAPGLYWFQVRYLTGPSSVAGANIMNEYFPFHVLDPTQPVLFEVAPARVGQDLILGLSAPAQPGGVYVAAASYTSNVGFAAGPTQYVGLDLDWLFALSFPAPDPFLFSNFQGGIDPFGNAPPIVVHVPNLPALVCKPLHVQVAVLGSTGPFVLSNPMNFAIAP